ncbi:kinase-like domain-containing protein [Jimgerdemannia flammicorona]|uniref:Kinase-like domain-containing protein n=1 Tax=Jimgerdemannia flammicorona TaxID=994334 RepID=A0A433D065_9FUNG|nr:kinase-like domain-containing protein [Jimgerdemannia flammicorona]
MPPAVSYQPHDGHYSLPCFSKEQIKLVEPIGRGGQGTIFRGTLGNTTVAVKQFISQTRLTAEEAGRLVNHNELRILTRLRELNFAIQVLGYYYADLMICIVMAYAENGDLKQYLCDGHLKGDWLVKAQKCADIAKAVDGIHRHGVIHGNLKASNILLDQHLTVKVRQDGSGKNGPKSTPLEDIGVPPKDVPPALLDLVERCVAWPPPSRPSLESIYAELATFNAKAAPAPSSCFTTSMICSAYSIGALWKDIDALYDEDEISGMSESQKEYFRDGMFYFKIEKRFDKAIEHLKRGPTIRTIL